MFSALFKQKDREQNTEQKIAHALYSCALLNIRDEVFYREYGVPDTFDGRFDLLLVHIFIILTQMMDQPNYESLSQALFDETFKDMDQTLREMGIGDMGVPKHMRRMMQAFNGRMHSYQFAIDPSKLEEVDIEGLVKTSLEDALRRNLYGTVSGGDDWDDAFVHKMAAFIKHNIAHSDDAHYQSELCSGKVVFQNEIPAAL